MPACKPKRRTPKPTVDPTHNRVRVEKVCGVRLDSITHLEFANAWAYSVPYSHNKLAHKGVERVIYWGERGDSIIREWLEQAKVRAVDLPGLVDVSVADHPPLPVGRVADPLRAHQLDHVVAAVG